MSEWKNTNLSELCSDISYGYTASATSKAIGPKFLRITDIVPVRIDWDTVPYCETDKLTNEKYKLQNGDIVIARTGATTGYNKIIKEISYNAVFASYLIRYKIDENKAYPYYIWHILQSENWSDYVDAIARGSAQPGANAKQLGSFEVSLPPLPEQKIIADYLDRKTEQIDTLIEKKQKQIELLKEQRAAIIDQAVTKGLNPDVTMKDSGVEWLGEIPEHWNVKRLKYISNVRLSNVDKNIHEYENQIYLCNYTNVYYNEKVTSAIEFEKGSCTDAEFNKCLLHMGDIIITKDSESPDDIGVPAYVAEDFSNIVCGYHLSIITPKKKDVQGHYLFRYLQSDRMCYYFLNHSNGITRYSIGKHVIENIFVPEFSIHEQKAIADFLDRKTKQIDVGTKSIQSQIRILKEYRTALITNAVTGTIDIRNEVEGVENAYS